MKTLKNLEKWIENKCNSLPPKRQKQIVIGILIIYVLLSLLSIVYYVYK